MSIPDKALFVFFCVVFGLVILGKLIFLVGFIFEAAVQAHWIAIPIGAIGLLYLICYVLAMQPK